ncbi:hypothetical protein ACHAAC_00085 [Aeromicrobium sp. CF4.19]|uniref:hypothetical protein n=1 Tax=Aeromicrobium sp. CF4.19 TaxID=3373082 RepID=UPI003EE6DE1F
MGMFDKIKASMTPPDHAAVLQASLGQERYLGHAVAIPSATESTRRHSIRDATDVAQAAAHRLTDKIVEDRHIGGDEGSVALSLPRSSDPMVIAISDTSLTWWKFGLGAKKTEPDLVASVPREDVVSVADTGSRKVRGHVRLSFADGSFFDYQSVMAPSEQFWQAAATFDPPTD